jgi:hypothetical protein
MGDISKEVANTVQPTKKTYTKKSLFQQAAEALICVVCRKRLIQSHDTVPLARIMGAADFYHLSFLLRPGRERRRISPPCPPPASS